MPSDRINPTVIPSMNEQHPANERRTSPKSSKSRLDIHPARKPEITSAEPVNQLKKQAREVTDLASSNNARLCPKQEQSNAFITADILGRPVDVLVDLGTCVSVIDAGF